MTDQIELMTIQLDAVTGSKKLGQCGLKTTEHMSQFFSTKEVQKLIIVTSVKNPESCTQRAWTV